MQGPDNRDAVIAAIGRAAAISTFAHLRGAYAFASAGGALTLLEALRESQPSFPDIRKRWLISLDFGYTEPEALELLAVLPNSEVRTVDSEYLLGRRLQPRACFHPKTLILDGGVAEPPLAVIVGSANLTVSGLRRAHEHAVVSAWVGAQGQRAAGQLQVAVAEAARFDRLWDEADPIDGPLLDRYRQCRARYVKHRPPPRSEDDSDAVKEIEKETGSLSRAARMAAADCFWVEFRKDQRNRGEGQAGNQIDLAKGSRAFFGVSIEPVPLMSPLGSVMLRYGNGEPVDRNLRFGHNAMDKLDLPIPGQDGPPTYEGQTLMFRRTEAGSFRMQLGTAAQIEDWVRRSTEQGSIYAMKPGRAPRGRAYGVFRL